MAKAKQTPAQARKLIDEGKDVTAGLGCPACGMIHLFPVEDAAPRQCRRCGARLPALGENIPPQPAPVGEPEEAGEPEVAE